MAGELYAGLGDKTHLHSHCGMGLCSNTGENGVSWGPTLPQQPHPSSATSRTSQESIGAEPAWQQLWGSSCISLYGLSHYPADIPMW